MKMITSTNIMQVNRVHHHHSLKQSWDRGQFWATWFKLKDERHCWIMCQSKKRHCSANWCFHSWSKGRPLTSVLCAICLLVLLLTSCAAYVSFDFSRWTALQDQEAPLKSTIDINPHWNACFLFCSNNQSHIRPFPLPDSFFLCNW